MKAKLTSGRLARESKQLDYSYMALGRERGTTLRDRQMSEGKKDLLTRRPRLQPIPYFLARPDTYHFVFVPLSASFPAAGSEEYPRAKSIPSDPPHASSLDMADPYMAA